MSFWKDKNVFVTGIGGFIGGNLARALVVNGANVCGLTKNINVKNFDYIKDCNLFMGDILDYDLLRHIISSNEIDAVFHLAAYAIVRISARDPLTTYNVNVMGTANVLEACRHVGRVKSILVASSDKAYGDHEELPYLETHELKPRNTYDTSKACVDMIARSYAYNYDMPITVSRCSNVYGPGDYNFSRLIPNTIIKLLNDEQPVLHSDSSIMEREFVFVEDVVKACLEVSRYVASYESSPLRGQAFNIGGTGMVTIGDVVEKIKKLMEKESVETNMLERETCFKEIQKQCIDSSMLNKITGWEPENNFDDGLKKTIEWYTKLNEEGIV